MSTSLGIGNTHTTTNPSNVMRVHGLGSCVVVILAVPGRFATGAHALLPQQVSSCVGPPGKYVDSAVDHLTAQAGGAGLTAREVLAVVVGGADLFSSNVMPALDVVNAT